MRASEGKWDKGQDGSTLLMALGIEFWEDQTTEIKTVDKIVNYDPTPFYFTHNLG